MVNKKMKYQGKHRVITVRMTEDLHDYLVEESRLLNASLNSICISKLKKPAVASEVEIAPGGRRGRKPGPQGPRKKNPPREGFTVNSSDAGNQNPPKERLSVSEQLVVNASKKTFPDGMGR